MRLSAMLLTAAWTLPLAAQSSIREVNPPAPPAATAVKAIVGATLIDGLGGLPLNDATVIIRGDRIFAAGPSASVELPDGAERFDGRGMSVLPGLIDSHFHLDGQEDLPALFLSNGITSIRDPGAWIEAYDSVKAARAPIPRLFLTGPHLDTPPPAYPHDAVIVRDVDEVRSAIERAHRAGASAVKAYFRLPLGLIREAVRLAHETGIPVTAHLEIVDARDAIGVGIDGIEHVTSLGTALVPARQAEAYRQAILSDNDARREGRFRMWNEVDLDSPRIDETITLLVESGVFLSPTLAIFERRAGDSEGTDVHIGGFGRMIEFVGKAHDAGARIVVGSHGIVPHSERGMAYQREMELLLEAGLTPMEVLVAGTMENARFFRIDDRLGSIAPGKLADLVIVEGNPVDDFDAMRRIRRVMLNGAWVR